jgi:hypothetical protein
VDRAEDLVFVFSNLRLTQRLHKVGFEERFMAWSSDEEIDNDNEEE